jgi:phytoene dehydrogenase-like protein
MSLQEEITLLEPAPSFRYIYPDGAVVDIYPRKQDSIDSVRASLGTEAAEELSEYLKYAARIWEAAAPHFVFHQAPQMLQLLLGGPAAWGAALKIDALRTLKSAIQEKVRSPHLRDLLMRYATYNGSDARTAPATLGCIAHVELSLGGYGVQGGMYSLVRALIRAAKRVAVECIVDSPVAEITTEKNCITGVRLEGGEQIRAPQVIANVEVESLVSRLLQRPRGLSAPASRSMSAYNGIYRASPLCEARAPHTVIFPPDYCAEFEDIFTHRRVPRDPTIYLCAQSRCHGRTAWPDAEPVFAMVNAPAVDLTESESERVRTNLETRLRSMQLLSERDGCLWWRTPADLAARFPGSHGALYGAASNRPTDAFRRPANVVSAIRGLYLASAHPGGGVPMVALSGKQAAFALLARSD